MISNLLYICGAPGVGKSTAMRLLRQPWDCAVMRHASVPHVLLRNPSTGRPIGVELGLPREEFPGTDALSMSIAPQALSFVSSTYYSFAMGEGARLATRPFLECVAGRGVATTLVRLTADPELLEERWRARGAKQSPSWRKGAETRARRFGEWFSDVMDDLPARCLYLDLDVTEMTPEETADRIREAFPLVGPDATGVPARQMGD